MLSTELLFEYSYSFIFHEGNEQLIIKVVGKKKKTSKASRVCYKCFVVIHPRPSA